MRLPALSLSLLARRLRLSSPLCLLLLFLLPFLLFLCCLKNHISDGFNGILAPAAADDGHFRPCSNSADDPDRNNIIFNNISRWGNFCVFFNFTRPQGIENLPTAKTAAAVIISLAVHSTLNFVHKLEDQASHWDGLISAAILVRPDEQSAIEHLLLKWHCSNEMRQKIALHLVWRMAPFQRKDSCAQSSLGRTRLPENGSGPGNCPPLMHKIADALDWPPLRYPINVLRNVARIGALPLSRVHIVTDVQNLFFYNFYSLVQHFAKRLITKEGQKEAFVFRRFEVEDSTEMPRTIGQLAQLIRQKRAFPFHRHHFPVGHHIPGLPSWLNYSLQNNQSSIVATELGFMNAAFEPQFLMASSAPLHFELVPARLYDHQVLVIELCRAGFHLRLLSHLFNVHPGVRRRLTATETLIKRIAAKQSAHLLTRFRAHLDAKYGPDNGDCPNFWNRLNLRRQKMNGRYV